MSDRAGVTVVGSGHGTDGETWELTAAGAADDLTTMVGVTTVDGRRHAAGMGGPALRSGRRLNLFVGAADGFPRQLVLRVSLDVRAVVVVLSDGTREDLVLFANPSAPACRTAALVYPSNLDVHRIDLLDADGAVLDEMI